MKKILYLLILIFCRPVFSEELNDEYFTKDREILIQTIDLIKSGKFSLDSDIEVHKKDNKFELNYNKIIKVGSYLPSGYMGVAIDNYYFNKELMKAEISFSEKEFTKISDKLKENDLELYKNIKFYFKKKNDYFIFEALNKENELKMKQYFKESYGELEKVFLKNTKDEKNYKNFLSYDAGFVYGDACGVGGSEPHGREEFEDLMEYKNKKIFLNILKGYNTTAKMYALEGIYRLKKKNIKFSEKENDLIKKVLDSNFSIIACGGCSFYHPQIKDENEVMKKYK